jgi:hypothetical protein
MNKFDQVYQSIISEAQFTNKKWIKKESIKDIQIFEKLSSSTRTTKRTI